MPDVTNNQVTVTPGGGSSPDTVTHDELDASHDDAIAQANSYTDSAETAAEDYTDSAVAPLAGVAGISVSPQYSYDVNVAAGPLTAHGGSIIGVPELSWPEWHVEWYYYATSGDPMTVGGFTTDGAGNLFFTIVCLSATGPVNPIGTIYLYIVGRP